MIQPSMDRTATAPVEVRASVVAGLLLGGGELSMSISVVAIVTLMRKIGGAQDEVTEQLI